MSESAQDVILFAPMELMSGVDLVCDATSSNAYEMFHAIATHRKSDNSHVLPQDLILVWV